LARFRTVSDGSGFTSVDPLAEKFYNISPYAYCHNNPVNRIDPDGRDDSTGTPTKKNKDGVDTTPQSTTAVKVPKKIEPTEMTEKQKANVLNNSESAKANKGTLKESDKMIMTPEDKAVATNPLVQGAAVVVAAPAVATAAVAVAENAVVLIESKPIWTIGAGLAEGYAKSKLNAPHDLPSALDNPYFQLASDTYGDLRYLYNQVKKK